MPSPCDNEVRAVTHPDRPTWAAGHYESTIRFQKKENATASAPPLYYGPVQRPSLYPRSPRGWQRVQRNSYGAQNVAWCIPAKPGIFLAVRLDDRARKLEGERIELRRHARENFHLYAEWYGDPEIWHLTSWAPSPLGRSAVEKLFEDRELSKLDDSFAIHIRGEDEPIGVISLMNKSEANESAELSVIVGHQNDRHRGYGTEAIERLLEYAFEELGLNRIGLSVFDFNEEAISAYEKLGFVVEGRFRQAIKRSSGFHDAILMSILKSEWEPRS
jgi:RimJ/RimL family protein N-acetyltransferase